MAASALATADVTLELATFCALISLAKSANFLDCPSKAALVASSAFFSEDTGVVVDDDDADEEDLTTTFSVGVAVAAMATSTGVEVTIIIKAKVDVATADEICCGSIEVDVVGRLDWDGAVSLSSSSSSCGSSCS